MGVAFVAATGLSDDLPSGHIIWLRRTSVKGESSMKQQGEHEVSFIFRVARYGLFSASGGARD
jgi:hypothetical protein